MNKVYYLAILVCLIMILGLNSAKAELLMASVADSTGVVGIDISVGATPVPVIKEVFKDGPAFLSGLKAGDIILMINNIPTQGLSSEQVDYAISDIPGTIIMFRVLRKNQLLNYQVKVMPLHKTSSNIQKYFDF